MQVRHDRPITKRSQDIFGYGPFAEALAKGIYERAALVEPYVIGIEAAWGMGKTSVANLIADVLATLNAEQPSDRRRVHVVRYSPWLSSSLEAQAISYMGELSGALKTSFGHRIAPDLPRIIKKLAKRFGSLASIGAGLAATPFGLGSAAQSAAKTMLAVSNESTEELANALRKQLRQIDAGQVVVIIDDIDRLHPHEILILLSLIKTFGDLPRVVHILLYDRRVVDAALAQSHGTNNNNEGPTYLEKVVQLAVTLPAVEHFRLRDFLVDQMKLLAAENHVDEGRVRQFWRDSLRDLLTSPRDLVRLTNALEVAWPAIADHADFLDFVGIETLRFAEPKLWARLRSQRQDLVGIPDRSHESGWKIPTADVLTEDSRAERREAIKKLVAALFPLTEPNEHRRPPAQQLRARRAIGSPEFVDVYFRFQPGQSLGRSFLTSLLEESGDRAAIAAQLEAAAQDRERLRSILSDFTDRLDEVVTLGELFLALVDSGDTLISGLVDDPPALHDNDVFQDLDELLWQTLKKVDERARVRCVDEAIRGSRSITIPAVVWQRLALRAGLIHRTPNRMLEPLASANEIRRLGELLASSLQSNDPTTLCGAPLLGWLLRIWAQAAPESTAPADAAHLAVESEAGLPAILDGIMGHAISSPGGAYRSMPEEPHVPGLTLDELVSKARFVQSNSNFGRTLEPQRRQISLRIVDAFLSQADELIANRSFQPDLGTADLLMRPLSAESLVGYALAKFPNLPPSEPLTQTLIKDLTSANLPYASIADIDKVVERAKPAVEAYSREQPQLFKSGTDFITKSLGFVDLAFREKHKFGKKTRDAFPRYESLIAR